MNFKIDFHSFSESTKQQFWQIFNAIVIVLLVPLALRGVKYRPANASSTLGRNLLVYGLGGVIAPFVGIWLIDLVMRLIPGF